MQPSLDSRHTFRTAVVILALSGIYFGASKLGFTMAFQAEQVTVVWPPTGIALAAVLLLGLRVWPGVMLGAFFANFTTHETFLTAVCIAAGNTLEAVVAAWILHHFARFDNQLRRLRDVLALVVVSAVFSTMISATIGVTSLCLGGVQPWASYGSLWLIWWVGDATGALIVAPVLLVWGNLPFSLRLQRTVFETLALVIGLLMTCAGIFAEPPTLGLLGRAFVYLVFPFIIWSALRFGQRGATLVTLAASAIAIRATMIGLGPFAAVPADQILALLQIFMTVTAVTGMLLAAAISERREAEKERAVLAGIVASSDDAIIGRNLDGSINYWNAGAERLFGYTAAEALGQPIRFLLPPDRLEEEYRILERLRHGEHIEHYETVRVAKNGRYLNVSVSVSPIRDDGGHIIGMSKVARDITERIHAEAALKDADRRKDEFLATLAHELRNPLAPLSHALHILKDAHSDVARLSEARDIMERQVKQMVRLVDDLLDVSRISHGKIELRKGRIALAEAISMALETVRPLIEAKNHMLSIKQPEETLWLNADLTRLAQLFANLLNNAAKYTPPGGHIQLEVQAHDNKVEVQVRDSGIGIPANMLPKIFNLFTQVDNSIERTHGGLGIGLTLVRTLTEMHDGNVEAYSKGVGQGSEFVVRLPLVLHGKPLPIPERNKPENASRVLRVLVVDDSQALVKTLGWMVELLGHEVKVANSGAEALALAKTFVPDVVLLDIGLSGMSGYDVCRKMHADPALKHTVFIAQTGWGQPEHRQRSKEAGFDHHLVKPIEIETLEDLFAGL